MIFSPLEHPDSRNHLSPIWTNGLCLIEEKRALRSILFYEIRSFRGTGPTPGEGELRLHPANAAK
jgi:hypothetical protein